jgi:hypothetical protein
MLTTIHNALAGRATRWIAVPTMAVAAGAALALSVSAGTIPTAFGSAGAARPCANRPATCEQPSVAATLGSLHIAKPAPVKALPALPATSKQAISPLTPESKARLAELRAAMNPRPAVR